MLLALLAGALAYQLAAAYGAPLWALGVTGLNLVVGSALAITVHRLVLLDAQEEMPGFTGATLRRLLRFFSAVIVVWAIYQGVRLLLIGIAALPFSRYVSASEAALPQDAPTGFWMVDFGASVLAWLVLGRLSLVFPVIATDQPLKADELWRAGRGNSWRLAVIVGALPWCLQYLADLLYRDGATDLEMALLILLLGIFLIVEVVALSLSYRALTAPAPPTSDPHA